MNPENYYYPEGLCSERLTARKITQEDVKAWTEFFKDQEAVQFIPDTGVTDPGKRAEHWIERQLARYDENRYGLQLLFHKASGELIGQCGLLVQEVDGIKELEVGYHMLKKHWGQGYAPEAAKMFLEFGFKHNLSDSIISIIHRDNFKSQRVADKNGLKKEKETDWNGKPVFIYRIQKNR